MKRTPKVTALALGAGLLVTGCGHAIQPGQVGLRYQALRHPSLKAEPLADGYYFQWGWNDIVTYDKTAQSQDVTVAVLTADDLHVPTTSTVTFHIDPDRVYELHTTVGPDYYEEIILPVLVTSIRDEFSEHEHINLARSSDVIEEAIESRLREALQGRPLVIDRVSIKHIRFDEQVTRSISQKLATQQESEQRLFEIDVAKRDAEIARTVAQGEADAIRIRAEGEAAATILMGEAQAESQQKIAATLTRDYLQFKAFDSPNTTYYFVPTGKDGLPLIVHP